MPYTAPIKDMLFDMQHLAQLDTLVQDIPVFADATLDTARSILEEAARFHQDRATSPSIHFHRHEGTNGLTSIQGKMSGLHKHRSERKFPGT